MLPSRKSNPRNLKIRLLSGPIFTTNWTKSRPKLAYLRSKSEVFKSFIPTLNRATFISTKSIFKEIIKLFVFFVQKALKMKIRLKADYSGKKMTNLRTYFPNGLISDQGLVKRTYLAALQQWRITHGSKCDVLFSQIMPSSRRVWVQNRV